MSTFHLRPFCEDDVYTAKTAEDCWSVKESKFFSRVGLQVPSLEHKCCSELLPRQSQCKCSLAFEVPHLRSCVSAGMTSNSLFMSCCCHLFLWYWRKYISDYILCLLMVLSLHFFQTNDKNEPLNQAKERHTHWEIQPFPKTLPHIFWEGWNLS